MKRKLERGPVVACEPSVTLYVLRITPHLPQGRRIKLEKPKQAKVVGWVALRPNQPALSGRHEWHESAFWPALTRRSARRDSSQREPFHLVLRRPWSEGRRPSCAKARVKSMQVDATVRCQPRFAAV